MALLENPSTGVSYATDCGAILIERYLKPTDPEDGTIKWANSITIKKGATILSFDVNAGNNYTCNMPVDGGYGFDEMHNMTFTLNFNSLEVDRKVFLLASPTLPVGISPNNDGVVDDAVANNNIHYFNIIKVGTVSTVDTIILEDIALNVFKKLYFMGYSPDDIKLTKLSGLFK